MTDGEIRPHARTADEVLRRLAVSPGTGLDDAEVLRRRQRHGPNALRRAARRSALAVLAGQFRSVIVVLLGGAAVLSAAVGQWIEGGAIAVVLAINALIGFITEMRAMHSMEALRRMAQVRAKVRRAGAVGEIPARDLVPGDIVLFEGGDVMAADLRLIAASRVQCDESLLTGESTPVGKTLDPVAPDAPLAERGCMAFKGTAVTRGAGEGVVVATGMQSELGRISALVEAAEAESTPLERRLERLSAQLVYATLALAAVIAGIGIAGGKDLLLMIQTGIALAVAAVPEGLPIVATMVLARGMWRMARRNALIERLPAVETLGATTVICADKTGTLTENRMTVTRILLADADIAVGGGAAPFTRDGAPVDPAGDHQLRQLLEVGVLCNDAVLRPGEGDAAGAVGDPMEVALLVAGAKAALDRDAMAGALPERREVAFDPEIKMMATVHETVGGYLVAVKGAPEQIVARAERIAAGGASRPMTDAERSDWLARNARLAETGARVLAIASHTADSVDADPYAGLVLLGLVGLSDPPRDDVPAAVEACRAAGMRTVMMTGDQLSTARSIAEAVGIARPGEAVAMEGRELEVPPGGGVSERLRAVQVFARVTPRQKLDLIALYQDAGEIVAMTGDGVNDAPALKKADIGIAMGLRGSQVAREAADMVLTDDAFPSIIAAIGQGRAIFNNIRRFAFYLLSCNLSEILVVGIATLGGMTLPLLPLQILFLNLVTDVFPAFALGACEGEEDIMRKPPRPAREPILAARHWLAILGYGIAITAATLGAFALAQGWLDLGGSDALTVSFLTLAFAQLWHAFNMRAPDAAVLANEVVRNPYLWGALVLCAAILLAAVNVPALSAILRLAMPGPSAWLLILGASLAPLLIGQIGLWVAAAVPKRA